VIIGSRAPGRCSSAPWAILIELAVWAPRRRRVVRTDGYEGGPVRRSTTEERY
jgi:hypothetical protein